MENVHSMETIIGCGNLRGNPVVLIMSAFVAEAAA